MAAGLAVAVAASPAGLRAEEDIRFFTIGTGASSSTYFLTGALLGNIISNPPGSRPCDRGGSCGVPGLIAVAQSTQGSVENMRRVGAGTMDSGLSRANIADWAYNGKWIFEGETAIDNLRAIANLYPEELHIVVRADSGIESVADLKGHRVSLGEEQSGTRFESLLVLRYYGLTADDLEPVYATPGHAADLLEVGVIDAFFIIASAPVAVVAELARRIDINLLQIDEARAIEIVRDHPYFTTTAIPAGAYEHVSLTGTLGIGTIWVTSANMDEDLVYAITTALWHERNRELLDKGHPKGLFIDQTMALEGIGIPLHPGAERYYREAGLLR
ncbi:MAG: TAXI family TRAP transporter solute-binding subunit [Alphaproteobacteria bacterium]|nr:TAXI family TRAP transporter solute-binding subunit [Alphaproteobacteria bacterium]